eukprot:7924017-Pyramimonas_sp.AAC.2
MALNEPTPAVATLLPDESPALTRWGLHAEGIRLLKFAALSLVGCAYPTNAYIMQKGKTLTPFMSDRLTDQHMAQRACIYSDNRPTHARMRRVCEYTAQESGKGLWGVVCTLAVTGTGGPRTGPRPEYVPSRLTGPGPRPKVAWSHVFGKYLLDEEYDKHYTVREFCQ